MFDWFVLSMGMQVILGSLFARPVSAPIWGGGGGERKESSGTGLSIFSPQMEAGDHSPDGGYCLYYPSNLFH